MRGGRRVIVVPHERFPGLYLITKLNNNLTLGIFLVKGKEDALATKNIVPGESVYGEKRISVPTGDGTDAGATIEYRVWNPFRSKLGAAVITGTENIHIGPGSKVLYLGAASGTTVSHVSFRKKFHKQRLFFNLRFIQFSRSLTSLVRKALFMQLSSLIALVVIFWELPRNVRTLCQSLMMLVCRR